MYKKADLLHSLGWKSYKPLLSLVLMNYFYLYIHSSLLSRVTNVMVSVPSYKGKLLFIECQDTN